MTLNDTLHEMNEALNFLEPRIRGIEDIQKSGGSAQLKSFLNAKLYDLIRRRNLCSLLLSEVESLLADGYPDIPDMPITAQLEEELNKQIKKAEKIHRQEIRNIEYVASIFTPGDKPATTITINLGSPADKPTR